MKGLYIFVKIKKKAKPKKFYLNINKTDIKKLHILNFSLDFEFGYVNYDSFRKLFITCIPESEIYVPTESVWLSFYKRVLSLGMVQTLYRFNYSMQHRPELINQFFLRNMKSESLYGHPQFLGILNSLIDQYHIIKDFNNTDKLTLRNASKYMISIDYTSIFNKDRNKVQELLNIGDMT